MKNKLDHFFNDMSPQARNAFLIGLTVTIINFIAALYLLYIGLSTNAPQFNKLAALVWVQCLMVGFGTILSRRGHPTAGMLIMLCIFIVGYPYSATLVSGFATVTGLALMVAGPIAAFSVLPRRLAWGMSIICLVSGLASILLDVFGPETRPSLPGYVIPSLAVLTVIAIGFLIVRQAWSGNIRTKLIVSFVLVAIISAWSVVFFANQASQKNLTEAIGNNLSVISSGQASQIGQTLSTQLDLLNSLALTQAVQQRAAAGTAADALTLDENTGSRQAVAGGGCSR